MSDTVRRMVTLNVKALRFALSSVLDDRDKCRAECLLRGETMSDWEPRFEESIAHLRELIATAQGKEA